jgi:hypothetical protein
MFANTMKDAVWFNAVDRHVQNIGDGHIVRKITHNMGVTWELPLLHPGPSTK